MRALWQIAIVIALAVFTISTGHARGPRVQWSEPYLELTAFPGTARSVTVTFSTDSNLDNASVWIVPELAEFLSIARPLSGTVSAFSEQVVQVNLELPLATAIGDYEGTIHIRSGRRTIPKTFTVLVHVRAPTAWDVPQQTTSPSGDRILWMRPDRQVVGDEVVVFLGEDVEHPEEAIGEIADSTGGLIIGANPEEHLYQLHYPGRSLEAVEDMRLVLNGLPGVAVALWNGIPRTGTVADDMPPWPYDWALRFIKAPAAWEYTQGSDDVVVAVVDRDIDTGHPDLIDNVGFPLYSAPATEARNPGHGTHVAGIACAQGNNHEDEKVDMTGVAWDCALHLHDAGTSHVDLYQALLRASRSSSAQSSGDSEDRTRIVSVSMGYIGTDIPSACESNVVDGSADLTEVGLQSFWWFKRAMRHAQGDVLWVLLAGNGCRDARYATPGSLGILKNVLTVAAVAPDGRRALFSNFGDVVGVAAPGVGIYSILPRWLPEGYAVLSGTSQAAPQVAGLAALVLANHPEKNAAEVKECIVNAAEKYGPRVLRHHASEPNHNFHVINAPEAVKCESEPPAPPPPGPGEFVQVSRNDPWNPSRPAVRNDGRKVAFVDYTLDDLRKRLRVALSDGSKDKVISPEDVDVYWAGGSYLRAVSYAGDVVAFGICTAGASCINNVDSVYLMTDTGNWLRTWPVLGLRNARGPVLSGDGSKIAFVTTHSDYRDSDLVVVYNTDGTSTECADPDLIIDDVGCIVGKGRIYNDSFYDLSMNHDGSRIAFAELASRVPQLWLGNSDGTGMQVIATGAQYNGFLDVALSADGSTVAYSQKTSALGIYVNSADGNNKRTIVSPSPDLDQGMSLSADGKKLCYLMKPEGSTTGEVYVAEVDTFSGETGDGVRHRLTTTPPGFAFYTRKPQISADGSAVAFTSTADFDRPDNGLPGKNGDGSEEVFITGVP